MNSRSTPLVPKELILPVCQRLAFVLFAMCSTALGIRLYARYKLGTLGDKKPGDRISSPLNGTRFFLDIGGSSDKGGTSPTRFLEESGWKGVCVKPFPDAERSCEPISMAVVPVDGDKVMVPDCSGQTSPLQVVLSRFTQTVCPNVERAGVGINALLKISKAPRVIDFIKLDTGGSERDIISRFPFDQFCVRAWAVNKAVPQSDIPKLLTARKCKVKEAGSGIWARCTCAGSDQSLLQMHSTQATTNRVVFPWKVNALEDLRTYERKAFKMKRRKSKKAWHSPAIVSSIAPVEHAESLADENSLLGGASGVGGSLMRRSFA